MDNKIKRKKRKRRIRTSTLFFLFLTLASNSFAWFIYSTKVSNSITAKVRSWHVNFNVGGDETTEEYIEVNIDDIYPGMQPFYQELKASNDGETDAKITYEVVSANVLGDDLIEKGMSSSEILDSFKNSYPLFFIKNYSAQVLKANMRIVGATEYAVVLYRDKLPKFNNGRTETQKGKMIFNWFEWKRDNSNTYPKIHPTQKPVGLLKRLIEIFTDEGDVVIDPVAGSASTLRACAETGRNGYGFEIKKDFCKLAKEKMINDDILNGIMEDGQLTFEAIT